MIFKLNLMFQLISFRKSKTIKAWLFDNLSIYLSVYVCPSVNVCVCVCVCVWSECLYELPMLYFFQLQTYK